MRAKSFIITGLFLLFGATVSLGQTTESEAVLVSSVAYNEAAVVKIYVGFDSELFVNGEAFDVNDVEAKIKSAKVENGAVWLAFEREEGNFSKIALMVIDKATEHRLPLVLYKDKTFSEPLTR